MKKTIYLSLICAGLLFAACEKEDVGQTATVAAAGQWYVTYDGADAAGNVVAEDVYGAGRTLLYTYNTAADTPAEMFVDDMENFWSFKVRVNLDLNTLTFGTDGSAANDYYDSGVTIDGGKILYGAAINPHGTAADSIVFYVTFSDDEAVGKYYDKLKVSGYRYTGLASDD